MSPPPTDRGLVGHGGPHVFVEDLEALELSSDDHHHLTKALRLRPGDRLTASDGRGRWRSCTFGGAPASGLVPLDAIVTTEAATPELTVAFALVKGSRPELVVQKLTELGIDRIQAFVAERSIVRWDEDKAGKNLLRLRRIAREAAMQSRRAWLPAVEPVTAFSRLAELPGPVRADMAGHVPGPEHRMVLIGPEGGWSDEEQALVPTAVGFGPHVMRAETAAIAAGAIMAALRAGVIASVRPRG